MPLVRLITLGVVKVLMAQNHLSVVANAAVSVFSPSTDRARIGLAAVDEFSSRSIKVGYHYTAPPIAASKVGAENPRLSVVVLGDCAKIKL
jgi:hypothetical protein